MTLQDAAENGISRIRMPEWARSAYLRINIQGNGYDPTGELYNPDGQRRLGQRCPEPVALAHYLYVTWFEEYVGEPCAQDPNP